MHHTIVLFTSIFSHSMKKKNTSRTSALRMPNIYYRSMQFGTHLTSAGMMCYPPIIWQGVKPRLPPPPPHSSSRLSTAPQPPLIRACKDDTIRNAGTAPANKTPLTGLVCWSVQVRLSESIFQFLPRQPEFVQRLVPSHLLTGLQRDLKTSHWVHYFRHGLQRGLLVVMDFLGHTIKKFGTHALDSFHLSDAAGIFLLCKTENSTS